MFTKSYAHRVVNSQKKCLFLYLLHKGTCGGDTSRKDQLSRCEERSELTASSCQLLQSLPQLSRGVHVPFHMAQSQSLSKIAVQGPSHSYSKQRAALTGIPCPGAPGLDDKGLVRSVSWSEGSTWPVLLFSFCTHPVSSSIRLLHSSLHFSTWSPENPTYRQRASVYTFCLYSTHVFCTSRKLTLPHLHSTAPGKMTFYLPFDL